jgi:cell division protein FtsX
VTALQIVENGNTSELARNVGQNPLPHALKVRAVRAEDIPTVAKRIEAAAYPGVQKVNYGEETTKRVIQAATVIPSGETELPVSSMAIGFVVSAIVGAGALVLVLKLLYAARFRVFTGYVWLLAAAVLALGVGID